MATRKRRRTAKPIPIGREEFGLFKLGVPRFDLRDPYHMAVSLNWPVFTLLMLGLWLAINLVFGLLYVLGPGDIANARPGSFSDAFFFSIETLATVGYGVMAPVTLYGHIVSATEIVTGMAFTAIVTGLLFVRFSRPKAKIVYADDSIITPHNGRPCLMLRVANGRTTMMSGASVKLFLLLAEPTAEGHIFRRLHELKLQQSYLPLFVLPWTLIHVIDEASPFHGHDGKSLLHSEARLFLTIEARDHALGTQVQDVHDYPTGHIRFGMRFADAVTRDGDGHITADLSRISLLEPDATAATRPG